MILENINFEKIESQIIEIFSKNNIKSLEINKLIKTLAVANFKCYKANMIILEQREREDCIEKYKAISDNEYIARNVGEQRVFSKAKINKVLSNLFNSDTRTPHNWTEDDVVYSVGEMLDRIIIEHIKQQQFEQDGSEEKKYNSKEWQDRVIKYLDDKLRSVVIRNSYKSVEEMRTYILKGNNNE
tara:strand:+ start:2774 stop:3328 length:555 start_codon:yes stop_codon:yes gene_type:complete